MRRMDTLIADVIGDQIAVDEADFDAIWRGYDQVADESIRNRNQTRRALLIARRYRQAFRSTRLVAVGAAAMGLAVGLVIGGLL